MNHEPLAPKFPLGKVVVTIGVAELMVGNEYRQGYIIGLLSRHERGDWGDVDAFDHNQNEIALRVGDLRIVSSYRTTFGKILIITEADRSSTCVLLPSEY